MKAAIGIMIFGLMASGTLVSIVGGIWLLVRGFRESIWWGLAMIFLPFAWLIFVAVHWDEAKKPFLIQVLGTLISLSGFVVMHYTVEKKAQASFFGAEQFRRMKTPATTPGNANIVTRKAPATQEKHDTYVGKTLAEVREILGEPRGIMEHHKHVTYLYPDIEIYSEDGKVVTYESHKSEGVFK